MLAAGLAADIAKADVVVIGPGLDDADRTPALLRGIAPLLKDDTSIVLDAYALGVLIDLEPLYRQWASRLVLTPNQTEGLWDVGAGHPGLGTSGSGDVLAAAVAGFLARKAMPAQAACWATYLHAAAGDRLAATIGPVGFLARELLDAIPRVLAELTT